ncbi:MAG TPA: hypothetical protein DCZ95_06655 [Verrucomicrobia bacterium]|nr:MAG: hypothetical protein A2X46_12980 [Lentisphaerae bacterium GWF2_57_35]HBA83758.1 hypothetical protein [Verrucomicrobiota bacterium]
MKILFVRHARAQTRAEFKGKNDLLRPLTPVGSKEARKAFKRVAKMYSKPDVILSSQAVRAVDTAELLAQAWGVKGVKQTEELNPGCNMAKFQKMLGQLDNKIEWVAVVGHDPDFSDLVSEITANGALKLDFKKAACMEVDIVSMEPLRGELKAFLPPRLVTAL